jgi:hypothetical protein
MKKRFNFRGNSKSKNYNSGARFSYFIVRRNVLEYCELMEEILTLGIILSSAKCEIYFKVRKESFVTKDLKDIGYKFKNCNFV